MSLEILRLFSNIYNQGIQNTACIINGTSIKTLIYKSAENVNNYVYDC